MQQMVDAVGGMSTSYSLPRTPDGLLSNVDEMDSSNTIDGQLGVILV